MSSLSCENCRGDIEVHQGEFMCTKCGLVMNSEVQPGDSVF